MDEKTHLNVKTESFMTDGKIKWAVREKLFELLFIFF